jgi:hypothetical protein
LRSATEATEGATPGCAERKLTRLSWKRPFRTGSKRTAFELSRLTTMRRFDTGSKAMLPLCVPTPRTLAVIVGDGCEAFISTTSTSASL